MVDCDLAIGQHPVGRRRQVRALDQSDRVVRELTVVDGAVETHVGRGRTVGSRAQCPDLLEADDLGPEPMRLLDIADVEDQMVDAGGAHSLGRSLWNIGNSVGHRSAPKSRLFKLVLPRNGARNPGPQVAQA